MNLSGFLRSGKVRKFWGSRGHPSLR